MAEWTAEAKGKSQVKIWNEYGSVEVGESWLEGMGLEKRGVDVSVVNRMGSVGFGTGMKGVLGYGWGSGLAKMVLVGGLMWIYRQELRIIGRGIAAGANLTIERWEEKKSSGRRGHKDTQGEKDDREAEEKSIEAQDSDAGSVLTIQSSATEDLLHEATREIDSTFELSELTQKGGDSRG